jgi:uncharacterized hydrophobic protein (TIGR00271 family)
MDEQSGHSWGIDFLRNEGQRLATRQAVSSGAALTRSYLAMNAAATLIAGFGLLQNSPAVIIGAMLIAMLFGPIVGIALGLAEANLPLLGRSFVSEIAGIAWVLAIGYAVGKAFAGIPIGSEILSRTSPTSLDLLIGLVGGLAGGFTYVAAGLTSAIVGVAIATALVPPLTSCGILLAHHLPELAAGAFLLFLANFTAIASGAMIAFWLAGHRPAAADLRKKVLLPRLISFLLLAVLWCPSDLDTPSNHHALSIAKCDPKYPVLRTDKDAWDTFGLGDTRGATSRNDCLGGLAHTTARFPRAGRAPQ